MRVIYTIATITAVLVLALATGAFVLSYDALRDLAGSNGVDPGLTWIFPLIVDGFIIVASLSVLRNGLLREGGKLAWALVVGFVTLSIVFNVIHAPSDLTARVIASVPPLALFLSFELLMGQVKSTVTRHQVTAALGELVGQVKAAGQKLDQVNQKVQARQAVLDDLNGQIKATRAELRQLARSGGANDTPGPGTKRAFVSGDQDALDQANDARQMQIDQRRRQVKQFLAQKMTHAEIARSLGVSESTVKRDIRALGNGRGSGAKQGVKRTLQGEPVEVPAVQVTDRSDDPLQGGE
jgi:DNA-binding CsgD family transcriptional regulator